jgi:hydrogenase small subunit
MRDDGLYAALVRRGMTRRSFLQFSAAMAAALALPAAYAPRLARAVETAPRIPVIWLRGQTCGGNTEALLRSADPAVSAMLLDVLSVEYHQSLLAVAGVDADLARTSAMERYPDGYLAVIEGAIPTGANGAYCLVGGRPLDEIAREVCDGAQATIALGACAFDGGAPAAAGGVTGAGGVRQVITGARLVTLPGCPMNVVNLAATIVHYLAVGELPPADLGGRPLFAYGGLIHNQCERRPHFEFGEFAVNWGDEGAQKGWCLYKLGCKGPETMANCPIARYGDGVSWNVRAGAGCVGCTTPHFWDAMLPAYKRLGSPVPFLPNLTVDQAGIAVVGGIGAVAAVHGAGMTIREHRRTVAARRAEAAAAKRHATAEARREAEEAAERAAAEGSVADVAGEPDAETVPAGAETDADEASAAAGEAAVGAAAGEPGSAGDEAPAVPADEVEAASPPSRRPEAS